MSEESTNRMPRSSAAPGSNNGADGMRSEGGGSGPIGRTPPHNLDAEEGLLAACVLDGGKDTMTMCLQARLTRDAFFKEAHKIVFYALQELYGKGSDVDEIILSDFLESRKVSSISGWERHPRGEENLLSHIGGSAYLDYLTNRIETAVHARHWLEIVREKWVLRRMISTATGVVERCFTEQTELDTFINDVEQEIFSISQDRINDGAEHISESVEEASVMIQKLLQGEVGQGVMSGYMDLDRMTFGFHPSEMIVLAARPSMGKTSFALNIAENCAMPKTGEPSSTLVFSLEMSADQLAMRMLCGRAKVNLKRVRDRILSKQEQHALFEAAKEIKQAPIWIDASGHITILEMRAKARRLHAQKNLSMIVVDYLQLIHGTDSRVAREQQIAEISRGIKAMAKELEVPIIVLSQLNRESEKEKRAPRLSDLRESGSIEQDADVVLMLARPRDSENDEADIPQAANSRELIVAKNRNGPVGSINLTFIPEFTRFENYTRNREE